MDLVVRLKNQKGVVMIDLKTGTLISYAHRLQLGGYTRLVELNTDIKITKRMILQLNKGIKYHPMKSSKEVDKTLFLYALNLYRGFQNG